MQDKKAKEAKRAAEALARARQRLREQREDSKDRTGIGLSSVPPRLDERSQRPWGAKPVTVESVEAEEAAELERQEERKYLQGVEERAKVRRAELARATEDSRRLRMGFYLPAQTEQSPVVDQGLEVGAATSDAQASGQRGNNDDLNSSVVALHADILKQAHENQAVLSAEQSRAISPSRSFCALWSNSSRGVRAGVVTGMAATGIGIAAVFSAGILAMTDFHAITLQQVLTAIGSKTLLSAALGSTSAVFALFAVGALLAAAGLLVGMIAIYCMENNSLARQQNLNIQQA